MRMTAKELAEFCPPVQSARNTEGRRRSKTELARMVAKHSDWFFDVDDRLTELPGSKVIAYTIEDAAAAMLELGWILANGKGVAYSDMPSDTHQRAVDLRAALDRDGRAAGVNRV